jgi:hypothetical protein
VLRAGGVTGLAEPLQTHRGLLQGRRQRAFQARVPLGSAQRPPGVGHIVNQHLPQPGGQLLLAPAAELVVLAAGFQQRLLHDVGGVELGLQPSVHLHAGQQHQVVSEPLQRRPPVSRLGRHDRPQG